MSAIRLSTEIQLKVILYSSEVSERLIIYILQVLDNGESASAEDSDDEQFQTPIDRTPPLPPPPLPVHDEVFCIGCKVQ